MIFDIINAFQDFNPHHPEGGDQQTGQTPQIDYDFNPHHPEGGDCGADLFMP